MSWRGSGCVTPVSGGEVGGDVIKAVYIRRNWMSWSSVVKGDVGEVVEGVVPSQRATR